MPVVYLYHRFPEAKEPVTFAPMEVQTQYMTFEYHTDQRYPNQTPLIVQHHKLVEDWMIFLVVYTL